MIKVVTIENRRKLEKIKFQSEGKNQSVVDFMIARRTDDVLQVGF